jgi:hypothetical protein
LHATPAAVQQQVSMRAYYLIQAAYLESTSLYSTNLNRISSCRHLSVLHASWSVQAYCRHISVVVLHAWSMQACRLSINRYHQPLLPQSLPSFARMYRIWLPATSTTAITGCTRPVHPCQYHHCQLVQLSLLPSRMVTATSRPATMRPCSTSSGQRAGGG